MTPQAFSTLLDANSENITALVLSIDEHKAQLRVPGKWNILEILEHVYLTEKLVYALLSRPSRMMADVSEKVGNEKLERVLVGLRKRRVQAPDIVHPKGDIKSPGDFLSKLNEQRLLLKNDLLSGRIIIDNRVQNHPLLGEMTITDWLNFIIHHCNRHLEQIKDTLHVI